MAEKTNEKRSAFVARVPNLQNRKWSGMEPKDGAAVVADILKGGKPAVQELIDGLKELDDGSDWQERLLLHQLVTQCSVPERKQELAMLAEVYAESALSGRPATVRSFLLQQLRLFADASLAPKLAPALKDDDPLVLDAVTAMMVSMGEKARETLEAAKNGAEGHGKRAISHALAQISKQ